MGSVQILLQPVHVQCLHLSEHFFIFIVTDVAVGYRHQKADEMLGNPTRGNQKPLEVKEKIGKPPSELGVSKFMKCDTSPEVL